MVLAAGYGSRLRPLTAATPKPLVPVGDRPALAHVLERLEAAGVDRVVVNAHFGAEAVAAFVGGRSGCRVSIEPELLGTAGGLARAGALLGDGAALVWNADILAPVDAAALVAAHGARPTVDATLVVQPRPEGQGSVGLDAAGRIVRLRGDRVPGSREAEGGEFMGVHVIGARLRGALPERGCLVGDVYIPALLAGARLESFRWDAPFFDIGSLERYLDANVAWLAERGRASWTGAGASVAGPVSLDRALVGARASVRGAGALERCVVWPGATAEAPLADAVVIPGAVVQVPRAKGSAHP
jgi:mannose-1-phosphate guanylyltransferase